jgi:hypothetical protein
MYLRAKPCLCDLALEFERDHCARCGRWLAHAILQPYDGADLSPHERLDAAIVKWQLKIREKAEIPFDLAKISDEQRQEYIEKLEADLALLEVQTAADERKRKKDLVAA